MENMHTDLPKTINEALKILAYNDYFWADSQKNHIKPHPKDKATVTSLAESQYTWTEKQARLALVILKRYLTKFQAYGMDIKKLLDDPVYDNPFRVINFEKVIEKYTDEDGVSKIELRFPYHKKIISLIRILKDQRNLPAGYYQYDGESKKWTFLQTDVTTYYLTLIAVRYDFKFVDESLLDDYDQIKKEIINYRQPTAKLIAGEIVLGNVSDSLQEYWNKNLRDKKQLVQVDSLKNFEINTNGIHVPAETTLGYKIAHNNNHMLWIDKNTYSKNEVVKALVELDIFPLLVPVNGDVNTEEEVKEFWEWLKVLEAHGIDILNQCSWGFDLKEPIYKKDIDQFNERTYLIDSHKPKEFFENLYELHQMSKQFKYINEETKILFVRNRIPRALIKSKIKIKASLITLGGGYYASGTDNLKRLLENLPKKLYYNNHQPSSWDWHDRIIVKL
jgi:hypothetical protein|tara:strand:+ start:679 stop:2022 length:1344 start_codon:yes stop_codon:yes gene_type:complete